MLLYLVRHGETPFTLEDRYTGSNDPSLLPESIEKARDLARYLRGKGIEKVYSSPLTRALQTASALVEAFDPSLKIVEDPRLREIHYGKWEGYTRMEILARDPHAFDLWDRDPFSTSPPEGEPTRSVVERIRAFWEETFLKDEGAILVTSHRTVLRLFLCMLLGIPLSEYRRRVDFLPVHLTVVELGERWVGRLLHHNLPPTHLT
jgi:broad specificity phosphatase PhoE